MSGFLSSSFSDLMWASLKLLDPVLVSLFQPICMICSQLSQGTVCGECRFIYPLVGPLCVRCGDVLSQELEACGRCSVELHESIVRIRSLLWLEESSKRIIHRIKFMGRYELLALFKNTLQQHFHPFFQADVSIIPVPLHFTKWVDRGFNQSEIIANWIADILKVPLVRQGLIKQSPTVAQSTLSKSARHNNIRRSFGWNPRVELPRRALIIDDIYTTGATLDACASALKRAGCEEIYAWTLFRTPRW